MRVLWWLAVGLALVWLIKGWRRQAERVAPPGGQADSPAKPAATAMTPQVMLRCAHCGMHMPAGEAIQADGRPYCSAAHRNAGPRDSARD